ncbi:hypothetical protein GCM10020219_005270 [Nonomuraea dietziae]
MALLAVGVVAVVGVNKWWNVRGISSARELALRGVAARGDDRTSAVVLGAAAVAAHPDKLNRSALGRPYCPVAVASPRRPGPYGRWR